MNLKWEENPLKDLPTKCVTMSSTVNNVLRFCFMFHVSRTFVFSLWAPKSISLHNTNVQLRCRSTVYIRESFFFYPKVVCFDVVMCHKFNQILVWGAMNMRRDVCRKESEFIHENKRRIDACGVTLRSKLSRSSWLSPTASQSLLCSAE